MKPTESKHDVYTISQNSLRTHHILLLKTGKLYLQNMIQRFETVSFILNRKFPSTRSLYGEYACLPVLLTCIKKDSVIKPRKVTNQD